MLCAFQKTYTVKRLKGFLLIGKAVVILCDHDILNCGKVVYQMELLEDKAYLISSYLSQILCALLLNVNTVKQYFSERRLIHTADNVHHCTFA